MPRKKKSTETVVESPAAVTLVNFQTHGEGDNEPDSEPSELNRLISEEEYSNDKAEVVVMNHTPATSSPTSSGSRHNSHSGPKTVDEDLDKISSEHNREPRAPEEEDIVDECCPLRNPDDEDERRLVSPDQPHSGEYKKIMDMLKEAEAEADPEQEQAKRRMEYLVKYNPRHPDSDLGFLDYCCAFFACFALCIEG